MKPFTIHDAPQRSDEWRQLRAGKLTGSEAVNMLATTQKGEAAKRRNLRTQYVLERVTGIPQESDYVSAEMKWGVEKEADALALYSAITGDLVRRYGFLQHRTLACGFSPDGIVGDFGKVVEAKAPKSGTHMQYLLTGKVPHEYVCQIRHGLFLTGAPVAVFVSYDPRFPKELQLFMSELKADALDIPGYERDVIAFLKEVDAEESAVRKLMQRTEAA